MRRIRNLLVERFLAESLSAISFSHMMKKGVRHLSTKKLGNLFPVLTCQGRTKGFSQISIVHATSI